MNELIDEFSKRVWETLQEYAANDDTGLAELWIGLSRCRGRPVAFTVARFSGATTYRRVMAYVIDERASQATESADDLAEMIWDSTWDPSRLDVDFGDIGFGGSASRCLAEKFRSPPAWNEVMSSAQQIVGSVKTDGAWWPAAGGSS